MNTQQKWAGNNNWPAGAVCLVQAPTWKGPRGFVEKIVRCRSRENDDGAYTYGYLKGRQWCVCASSSFSFFFFSNEKCCRRRVAAHWCWGKLWSVGNARHFLGEEEKKIRGVDVSKRNDFCRVFERWWTGKKKKGRPAWGEIGELGCPRGVGGTLRKGENWQRFSRKAAAVAIASPLQQLLLAPTREITG